MNILHPIRIMKRLFYHISATLLCVALAAALAGCADDLIDSGLWDEIPEGETVVGASVNFHPFSEGLADTRSSGSAIKDVENFTVLVYRADNKEFVRSFYITKEGKEYGAKFTTAVRNEEFPDAAEESTAHITFSMPLPFGRYQMLVVANMGDITKSYSEEIYKSIDNVRNIRLKWNEASVGENNQMYGFFTNADVVNYEPVGTELSEGGVTPNIVTVARHGTTLQAWIKRAASKVTVAYDGSKLADNVRIYIQSVQIRDIPQYCLLGAPSTVALKQSGEPLSALYEDRLIQDGEKYVYGPGDEGYKPGNVQSEDGRVLNSGLYISNGPSVCHRGSSHSEDDPHSLYFFENNQDRGEPKWQDKSNPDKNNNAQVSYPGSVNESHEYFKDKKRGGTFIEVKGFYLSDNDDRPGSGEIIYRFMLGQDIDRDYRALRNCHYKLTLKFNGYANDIDWHIEYDEPDPSMTVRTPQYVSYLYNRTMHFNVKVAGKIPANAQLKARISENHWYPDGAPEGLIYTDAIGWTNPGFNPPSGTSKGDENGFLSLYKPSQAVIVGTGNSTMYNVDYYFNGSNPLNKKLYERSYDTAAGRHPLPSNSADWHEVREIFDANGKQNVVFSIPLYTRARSISEARGHTGNNVFSGHYRVAYVVLTLDIGGGRKLEKTIEVRQVERIVNPKAIWRSDDCTDPFEVKLSHPKEEDSEEFEEYISDGPWRAEKVSDNGIDNSWYTITALGDSENGPDGTVTGKDQTRIHFQYKPNGRNTTGKPRCGVIRVYYNNYTCVHLIFVRQGYGPLAMRDGEVMWHSFNVESITASTTGNTTYFDYSEASDPRDEGSYFRWGASIGIKAKSNRTYKWGEVPGSFDATDGKSHTWKELEGTRDLKWPAQKGNSKVRLANHEDFLKLFSDEDNKLNTDIEYGYGVMYGDGATTTALKASDCYGYYSDQKNESRGMRGCIVYNRQNGRQLFFPIGAEGHGRRKSGRGSTTNTTGETKGDGILRYANRNTRYDISTDELKTELKYRPLFYDLFMRPGAVYWCNNYFKNGNHPYYPTIDTVQSAWDFNYYTLNYKYFNNNASPDGWGVKPSDQRAKPENSDACLMRLVTVP